MYLIKTKRMVVRAFNEQDLDSLVSLMTDADTMRWTGFKKPQSVPKIKELLGKWQIEGRQPLGVWAVNEIDSAEFVGWVMLKPTTEAVPELGYMIQKSKWGHGYATELTVGLLQYGSRVLNLSKVIAVTSPENLASVKVLEKAGMTRVDGEPRDDGGVCFEIFLKN